MAKTATNEKVVDINEVKEAKKKTVKAVEPVVIETDEEKAERLRAEAFAAFSDVETLEEAQAWWKKYYMSVGHRNLGRMFVGTYKK